LLWIDSLISGVYTAELTIRALTWEVLEENQKPQNISLPMAAERISTKAVERLFLTWVVKEKRRRSHG
jgi:hypothetical protein